MEFVLDFAAENFGTILISVAVCLVVYLIYNTSSCEKNFHPLQRRFTHTVLKDLGMGKGVLEPKIHEEIESYLSYLDELEGKPTDPHLITMMAIANIIFSIVKGHRSDYNDEYFNRYMKDLNDSFEALGSSGLMMAFPFLRHLPGDPFSVQWIMRNNDFHGARYLGLIHSHRESHDPENPRDLIDLYLNQMKEEEQNPNTTFSDAQLVRVISDLFGAGTETTSNTLLWSMIFMLRNPDVMKQCQREIYDVIGENETPSMKHKSSMPYVESTILEIQRMSDIVPFAVPHTAVEDIEFKGYYFPAGTNFMPNLYAVHFDPITWPEPYSFKPSRHLTEDGKILKKEQLIPFSIGRRVCVGESLAKMELFLFFTSLLQKFDLVLPEGCELPPLQGKLGATHVPPKFDIVFRKRR